MIKNELVKGNKYLVSRYDRISLYEVLTITNTSYQFKYENGNIDWMEKNHFHTWYTVIENVTEFEIGSVIKEKGYLLGSVIKENGYLHETKQEFETCPICHGMGIVPDTSITAGSKTCPLCLGAKLVIKTSQIIS